MRKGLFGLFLVAGLSGCNPTQEEIDAALALREARGVITPDAGVHAEVADEHGMVAVDFPAGAVTEPVGFTIAMLPVGEGTTGLATVAAGGFALGLDGDAVLQSPGVVRFVPNTPVNLPDGTTDSHLLFPVVERIPSPPGTVPVAYPYAQTIDRIANTTTVELQVTEGGKFTVVRSNYRKSISVFPDVTDPSGATHLEGLCYYDVGDATPIPRSLQVNLPSAKLSADATYELKYSRRYEVRPLTSITDVAKLGPDVPPKCFTTATFRLNNFEQDPSPGLVSWQTTGPFTLVKEDPAGPCIMRGDLNVITVTSKAIDQLPGGGGSPGPTMGVSVPGDNPEAACLGLFPLRCPVCSLASADADPAILVGAKVLHTFEPPPGVPPPPPPGPQPELVQAILALDPVTGDELARLPLGDLGDAGLSCQLLSYNGASGRVDQFFIYGQVNFAQNVWNPDIPDFGATSFSVQVKDVTDFSRYSNDQFGGGGVAAWFAGSQLLFFEYDPAPQIFVQKGSIEASQFAGASGGAISGFRWEAGGQTVFVTDGQPGELWSHPGGSANATKIGNLGNGPRQIRFVGEIGAVSNFDSGTLTIVRRQGDGTVTILGTADVGDGPIGLDLRLNSAGNIEVLSTGFHDHTYTLTVLSPTGTLVGTPTTRTVPEGGLNPVHAIFVNAGGTRISITCNGSDEVLIFDLPS